MTWILDSTKAEAVAVESETGEGFAEVVFVTVEVAT